MVIGSPSSLTSLMVTNLKTFSVSSTVKNSTNAKSFYSLYLGSFGCLFLTSLISLTGANAWKMSSISLSVASTTVLHLIMSEVF